MVNILIFGACSFPGRHLIELLIDNRSGDPLPAELSQVFASFANDSGDGYNFATNGSSSGYSGSGYSGGMSSPYSGYDAGSTMGSSPQLYIRAVDKVLPHEAFIPASVAWLYRNTDFYHGDMWSDRFIESCFQPPLSATTSVPDDMAIFGISNDPTSNMRSPTSPNGPTAQPRSVGGVYAFSPSVFNDGTVLGGSGVEGPDGFNYSGFFFNANGLNGTSRSVNSSISGSSIASNRSVSSLRTPSNSRGSPRQYPAQSFYPPYQQQQQQQHQPQYQYQLPEHQQHQQHQHYQNGHGQKPASQWVWDVVIILTDFFYWQTPTEFLENIFGTTRRIILAAERLNGSRCRQIVFQSNMNVYRNDDSHMLDENDPFDQGSIPLRNCLAKTEQFVMSSERFLPTVLLRPAFMYGPGDFTTFNSMLVMAEISRRQGKPTMVYYGDEIRLDMIHVRDVARSILHAAIWHASMYSCVNARLGQTGNDMASAQRRHAYLHALQSRRMPNSRPITTAQRIEIFNVTPMEHRLVSELTTMAMHTVGVKTKRMPYLHRLLFKNVPADVIAKKVNEQYLPIWDEMVRTSGARPSPVGPRLDPVQLKNGHHCSFLLNGSKLLHGTGFVPMYPICSEFTWMEVIDEWRSMDIWPKELSVTC